MIVFFKQNLNFLRSGFYAVKKNFFHLFRRYLHRHSTWLSRKRRDGYSGGSSAEVLDRGLPFLNGRVNQRGRQLDSTQIQRLGPPIEPRAQRLGLSRSFSERELFAPCDLRVRLFTCENLLNKQSSHCGFRSANACS